MNFHDAALKLTCYETDSVSEEKRRKDMEEALNLRQEKHRQSLKLRFAGLPELLKLVDEGNIREYDQIWYLASGEWFGIVRVDETIIELTASRGTDGAWKLHDACATFYNGAGTVSIWWPKDGDTSWPVLWQRLIENSHNDYAYAYALAGLQFWLLINREGKNPHCLANSP